MSYSHTEPIKTFIYAADGKVIGHVETGVREMDRRGRETASRNWPPEFHRRFNAKGEQIKA